MAGLFVDTWGWLALRDKAERRHDEAAMAFKERINFARRLFSDLPHSAATECQGNVAPL